MTTKSINNFRRIKIKMDINLKRIGNFVKLKTFGTPSVHEKFRQNPNLHFFQLKIVLSKFSIILNQTTILLKIYGLVFTFFTGIFFFTKLKSQLMGILGFYKLKNVFHRDLDFKAVSFLFNCSNQNDSNCNLSSSTKKNL